ncbi:hypothetical protein EYC84_004901 [Monilinia fructicola]|uniref:Uncharacterized protein n=1 Tax=Monilinia fructicola TaxID=38448 RepID=A0A5M9K4R4_MONFR|nr:hypothetical protein EYC84_004901 [Monilinia fructicola]
MAQGHRCQDHNDIQSLVMKPIGLIKYPPHEHILTQPHPTQSTKGAYDAPFVTSISNLDISHYTHHIIHTTSFELVSRFLSPSQNLMILCSLANVYFIFIF